MADATHTILWRRALVALRERAVATDGNPREIAARTESALGTDALRRFVNDYYLERQYGGGAGRLANGEAEALVEALEALPRFAPAEPPAAAQAAVAPRDTVPSPSRPGVAPATARTPSPVEEAEAYGLEEDQANPVVRAFRQYLRDLAAERRLRRDLTRQRRQERDQPPPDDASLRNRARERAGAGDTSGAIVLMRRVVAAEPEDAEAWFALASYYGRSGNVRQATDCYRHGVALDPANKVAWNNLGYGLALRGRHKDAVESLRKALELDPDYAAAWSNLGAVQRACRNFAQAATAFEQVTRLRPDDGPAWYWLGASRADARMSALALEALQRASELLPESGAVWQRLGDVLARLGRRAEARTAYARAGRWIPAHRRIGPDVLVLAPLSAAVAYVGKQLDADTLSIVAIVLFLALVWRLKVTRPQLFFIAVPALPALATLFLPDPDAGPIVVAALALYALAIARAWRRLARAPRDSGSSSDADLNAA